MEIKYLLRGFTVLVVMMVCVAVWPASARSKTQRPSTDWTQWLGPNGNGISDETGWRTNFPGGKADILWQRRDLGVGYSSVSIHNGKLYTMGWNDDHDIVYCLTADGGKPIWQRPVPAGRFKKSNDGGPGCTPAVDGDRVYAITSDGLLFCLNADTGEPRWEKNVTQEFGTKAPRWGFAGSPIIQGNVLYLDVGRIVALDKMTGKPIWATKENYGAAYSTPKSFLFKTRDLLAAFPERGLVILDAKNGRELATHGWKTRYGVHAATPIVEGDRIFISSGYNTGCAALQLTDSGLKLLWENRAMKNQMDTSVLIDGYLYGFDDSLLRCVSLKTGRAMWGKKGLGKGSLQAADGKLIILSSRGELVIARVSPKRFDEISRAKVLDGPECWTVPVLSGGRIYCRNNRGQIACVDVSGK